VGSQSRFTLLQQFPQNIFFSSLLPYHSRVPNGYTAGLDQEPTNRPNPRLELPCFQSFDIESRRLAEINDPPFPVLHFLAGRGTSRAISWGMTTTRVCRRGSGPVVDYQPSDFDWQAGIHNMDIAWEGMTSAAKK